MKGKTVVFGEYAPPRPAWDHDHCEFCMAKFSLFPGDLKSGYSTTEEQRWVCTQCFMDFRDEFAWVLRPAR